MRKLTSILLLFLGAPLFAGGITCGQKVELQIAANGLTPEFVDALSRMEPGDALSLLLTFHDKTHFKAARKALFQANINVIHDYFSRFNDDSRVGTILLRERNLGKIM